MNLLLSWLILAVSVWITAALLPGVKLKSFGSAFVVAAIFGVLNLLLGWLFFTVFAVATLGIALLLAFITRWIIDAILLYFTAKLTDSLEIDGFKWALIAALVMSVLGTIGQWMLVR
jgi:putative membrane protein